MTDNEIHRFAVDVLMDEYSRCGVSTERIRKEYGCEADFLLQSSVGAVNVVVVYGTVGIPSDQVGWLAMRRETAGELARVTYADALCVSPDEAQTSEMRNGKPAICGGSFCFKFYSVNPLLEGESEEDNLGEELSALDLANKYAEAWRKLDAGLVFPYLSKDFHYGSEWVFDELASREEFERYFSAKMATIRRTDSHIDVGVGLDSRTGEVAVLLTQGRSDNQLRLAVKDGRIVSARMEPHSSRFQIVAPEDQALGRMSSILKGVTRRGN